VRRSILGLVVVLAVPTMLCAQKRLVDPRPHSAQYVAERLLNGTGEMALDVCGGRDKVYLNATVDPTNINLLWSLRQVGDAVMFVSRVDGMALDANGGQGNPYPREADPSNINHLWLLAKVGDSYMIWSKVTNVVLDANGGRGRPYLSTNPDPRNINHLWELRAIGDHIMLVPRVRATAAGDEQKTLLPTLGRGQVVPPLLALAPDGRPALLEGCNGKYVLLVFWSIDDEASLRQFDQLRKLRRDFANDERLIIISVCVDDKWDAWRAFITSQGQVDYGDRRGKFDFSMDHRWWQVFNAPNEADSAVTYGVKETPRAFLIGPDRRLLATSLANEELRDAVVEVLRSPQYGPLNCDDE
jgi:Thioredoxin-like